MGSPEVKGQGGEGKEMEFLIKLPRWIFLLFLCFSITGSHTVAQDGLEHTHYVVQVSLEHFICLWYLCMCLC